MPTCWLVGAVFGLVLRLEGGVGMHESGSTPVVKQPGNFFDITFIPREQNQKVTILQNTTAMQRNFISCKGSFEGNWKRRKCWFVTDCLRNDELS